MANTIQSFIPLRALIDSLPGGSVSPQGGDGILDQFGISDFAIEEKAGFATIKLDLAFADELGFELPGVDGLGLYFSSNGATNSLAVETDIADDLSSYEIRIVNAGITARFPPAIFRTVRWTGTQFETVKGPGGQPLPYEITIGGLVSFDSDGDLTLTSGGSPPALTLAPLMIGNTGVVIEADSLEFYLSKKVQAPGQPLGWRGVHIQNAKLHLPGSLAASVGILQVGDAYIGSGGFTGSVTTSWPNGLAVSLFGVDFILKEVSIGFVQNVLVQSAIKGRVTLPFFDQPVGVEIGFTADGGLTVGIADSTGLAKLSIPKVLDLELDSLKFDVDDGVLTATISGKLTPTFPGFNWPAIDLKDLKIDSKGNVKLPDGWLDLPKQYGFNFHGFKVDITKFGMGRNEDGTKWIGFSGGVKLVDGLPAGASVDGLRITANPNWAPESARISFDGVGVELDAKAFHFKGAVSYREFEDRDGKMVHRFDGDILLELRSPELKIDGSLVVGSVAADTATDTPAYNFFAIYVGVDLPTGIPLGATGLAFYGFEGLLAIEMAPDKKPEEAWYAIRPAQSWYKRPDVGVARLKKWANKKGSKAFGAGVTLGTYADNGYTFNGKVLFAIVFPGPIILIEGLANLLKDRAQLTERDDPDYRALAVIDNSPGARSLLVGLDVKYQYDKSTGGLIKINAGTEAYYEFDDPSAWHIYLGIKEPREQRIQADILSLFKANAYLMLNAHELAMGAWVGYDNSWKFGPLSVTLQAWMESNVVLSFRPAHLHGDLWVHGAVDLKAFGFGLGLIVDARLAADVFHPFVVVGDFEVELHLPWPLSKKHIGAHVKLQWGPRPKQPPIPAVLKDVAIEHFKTSTKWPLPALSSATTLSGPTLLFPDYADADGFLPGSQPAGPDENPVPPTDAPSVPLDCRPSLGFTRNVNDDAKVGTIVRLFDPESEQVGDPVRHEGPGRVRYGLQELRLEKWNGLAWQAVAGKGGNSGSLPELFGTWAPINGTSVDGTGQDKLLVWSKTGFDHMRHTGAEWGDWFTGAYPDFPCLPASPVSRTCFDFEDFDSQTHYPSPLTHPKNAGMRFEAPQFPGEVNDFTVTTFPVPIAGKRKGLRQHFATGTLTIIFDQPVNNLRIVAGLIGRDVPFNVTVFDKNGAQFGPFPSQNNVVDISVGDVTSAVLGLPDVGMYHLLEVCPHFGPVKKAGLGVRIDDIQIIDPAGGEMFVEGFDGVGAPALPSEWTTAATGSQRPWVTSPTNPASAPNDAFAPYVSNIGSTESELITPEIKIPSRGSIGVTFKNLFNMDASTTLGLGIDAGFDGMVLEISINGEPFLDITDPAVRGTFLEGGYRHIISSEFGSPLAGRMAWSGLSNGTTATPTYIDTHVTFPAAANVRNFRLKWRVVTDNRPSATNSGGAGVGNDAAAQAESIRNHNRSSTAVWSARGSVLEPYTNYRLRIVTTADLTGTAQGVSNRSYILPQLAYFQTKGPPGLSTLTKPTEPPYPADLVDASHTTESKGGLDDLTLYVKQTIPPTVPKIGELPLLPRPVYRGYDVGVQFNEDYVDLMYRLAGRDLSLLLYDRNNQPVRDHSGRLIVLDNPWGVNEQLSFNAQETPWISLMNGSPCVDPIDLESVPRDQTLQAAGEAQILDPDTLYDARLMPLLVHEDFSRIPAGTSASAGGSLGRWRVSDLVGTGAPSHWQIEGFGAPAAYRVIQTSGIGVPGTMLILGDHPGLPGDDSSQPSMWRDYRVSLYLRSHDGTVGVAFRYVDDKNFYLFTMDGPNGAHLLLSVADQDIATLAEEQISYEPDHDYHLVIEAIGDSLRIYLDETLLFDVTDTVFKGGGLALQCSNTNGAAFADIQVHDFSKAARNVYRFSFTTSEFVDFFHHLHSFDDECWLASCTLTETELVDLDARSTSDQNSPILDDEARAFERLADNVLQASANPLAARTEITRLKRKGSVGAAAFLLRTPEPVDWRRTSLGWAFSAQTVPPTLAPGAVKLVAASLGSPQPAGENVTLLVREPTNLTGYRIEKREVPLAVAAAEPPAPAMDDPASAWISIYEFGSDNVIAPGTQVVVNSGNPDNPPTAIPRVLQRFRAPTGAPGDVQLAENTVDLRLVDSQGAVVHARRFLNSTTSYNPVNFHVLRKGDGTAFFLLPDRPTEIQPLPMRPKVAVFPPGTYQMTMNFRRDNTVLDPDSLILSAAGQKTAETAVLDVPWSTL